MYFIQKVKYVDGDYQHPRHKIIKECGSLENALKALEDVATSYIIKKIKPSFVEPCDVYSSEAGEKGSTIRCEVKYTMNQNKNNNNIIEIYERTTNTKITPGYV